MSTDDKRPRLIQGSDTRDDLSAERAVAIRRARTNADADGMDFTETTAVRLQLRLERERIEQLQREADRKADDERRRARRESEAKANITLGLADRAKRLEERVATLEGDCEDFASLRKAAADAASLRVELTGERGTNGRMGLMAERLNKSDMEVAKLAKLIEVTPRDLAMIGVKIVGVVVAIVTAAIGYTRLEAQVAANSKLSERNQIRIEQLLERIPHDQTTPSPPQP